MIFEEQKVDTSSYTFVIDGNYLAMRMAFAVGLDFKSDPKKHSAEYLKALCQSTANLIGEYKQSLGKVMMVIDGKSWRKNVDMIVPQLRQDLPKEEQQYKANRKKDESDIDLKVVMTVFRSFAELLNDKFNIPLIQADGAEGDDLLYVVANEEVKNGRKCLLYTSDGDISQLINDDVMVLKQMPADRPNKIVISESKMSKLYPNASTPKNDDMFIFGSSAPMIHDLLLNKFKEEDTMTINAAEFLLLKTVSGDKKDNIHPTFLWKKSDSTGMEKEYKPTAMYIKKGFEAIDFNQNEFNIELLYDMKFIRPLLFHILKSTPIYPKLSDVTRTYKANLKFLLQSIEHKELAPLELVKIAIVGDGSENLPHPIVMYDGGENMHTINNGLVDDVFSSMGLTDLSLKEIKATKFPKPFLETVLKFLPPMRDMDLMMAIYEQNLSMLHLNEKSIPKEVIEASIKSYNEKKDIVCDMDIVTDFKILLSGTPSSDNIFNGLGLDEHVKTTSSGKGVGKSSQVDLDTDDILSTVFGGFGEI